MKTFLRLFVSLIILATLVFITVETKYCYAEEENNEATDNVTIIMTLKQYTIDTPSVAEPDIINAMEAAGKTKRTDALQLLIKGLAYNVSPSTIRLDGYGRVPAISILNYYFKEQALPSLYIEGITTDKLWMRERCAVAIRTIASREDITILNKVFSLEDTTTPGGKRLLELLSAKEIPITLYTNDEVSKQVDQAISNAQK